MNSHIVRWSCQDFLWKIERPLNIFLHGTSVPRHLSNCKLQIWRPVYKCNQKKVILKNGVVWRHSKDRDGAGFQEYFHSGIGGAITWVFWITVKLPRWYCDARESPYDFFFLLLLTLTGISFTNKLDGRQLHIKTDRQNNFITRI